ncbi:MAG: amidase [Rhodobacteraceae bacterium]|nr:amidase [Paracoccaceae bacterium]
MPDYSGPDYSGPDLCAKSARSILMLLRTGEIRITDLVDASLERIKAVEPAVNAMPTVCADRAYGWIDEISDLEKSGCGWLGGIPIGVKDLNAVRGVKLTMGTWAMRDFVARENDPLVDTLQANGAIVIGKTNTPEFGAGGNTFNQVFGMTRNAYDTSRNAGGSSGGAAVSLATGEVWLSQGSDLAGSLRTPAGYNNVCGLRPTPGRAGGGPGPAAFLNEGINGPMARDIEDLALFLDAMTGYDPREPLTLEKPAVSFQEALKQDIGPIRIAFAEDQGGFAPVEANVRTILCKAMEVAQRSGMAVDEDCPDLPGLYETYVTLRGIHYGSVNGFVPDEIREHFKETLRRNIEAGVNQTSHDIYLAQRRRTELYQRMRRFLARYDVLAIPVVGLAPTPVEEEWPKVVDGIDQPDYVDWLRFSFLATVTALPALSMPAGFTGDGLPIGIQLIGPPRGDAKVLQAGLALERALDLPKGPIDPVVRHETGAPDPTKRIE